MKRTTLLILSILAVATMMLAQSCKFKVKPSDNMQTRTIILGDFYRIETARVVVEYSEGTPGEATLTAPDNVIDDIIVTVKDGKLVVRPREVNRYESDINATLIVSSTGLTKIEADLAGRVVAKTPLCIASDFKAEANTAGSIRLDSLKCAKADIEANTAGTIRISTLLADTKVDLEANTAGNIKIDTINTDRLDAEANTAGNIRVSAGNVNFADLEANTAGNIKVDATGADRKAESTTGGNIR